MKRPLDLFPIAALAAVLLVASAAGAPPKPSPGSSAVSPAQTGAQAIVTPIPRPDLVLTEVRLQQIKANGTMPGGQTCWIFSLQPVFHNAGKVNTGPFKVVWERADAEAGPYVVPCPACTMTIANAAPGVGMLPEPRQFNNCSGPRWYRVRLDPDNVVKESHEDNNSRTVHF